MRSPENKIETKNEELHCHWKNFVNLYFLGINVIFCVLCIQ